ncbi:VrrA/YqfQ family protein [Bacillus horti]|uniref:YqfQ-like protein n=2 Tax=Caldalkalibacillus horti TaxID=77523 RepID=A0ABT9W4B9_9BACI|nr:VrrA/YqfQ family protein [Bacillus horti]MDQ0168085.1 hypothetical protein [Bacillus horti]
MVKQNLNLGRQAGFLLGQASNPAANPGSMLPSPTPFMNQSAPVLPGGNSPFFGGGSSPFLGGLPFQGGPGSMAPMAPGGTGGGLGGMLKGLLGGNGSLNLPSILSNAQKMIGAVNQAGEVVRNVGPMLQMLKGLNLSELLQDNDDELKEEEAKPKKKQKRKKRSKSKKGKGKKTAKSKKTAKNKKRTKKAIKIKK